MKHEWIKLHERILRSSIWFDESPTTLKVFLGCLLLSDTKGDLSGTDKALAANCAVTEEDFRDAMAILMAPDPNSQTPDEEGRRIVRTGPASYRIVNRKLFNADPTGADRQRRYKERTGEVTPVTAVTLGNAGNARGEERRGEEKRREEGDNGCATTSDVASPAATTEGGPAGEASPNVPESAHSGSSLPSAGADRRPGRAGVSTGADGSLRGFPTREDAIPVLTVPTAGKPDHVVVFSDFFEEVQPLYPSIDCVAEANRALQWCLGNHLKTARGMRKFLTGWFDRSQNRARSGR